MEVALLERGRRRRCTSTSGYPALLAAWARLAPQPVHRVADHAGALDRHRRAERSASALRARIDNLLDG